MWRATIEPTDTPDHDKRTFECPRCLEETVEIVKYR
jgi:transcription elongation factor Elf1